MEPGRAGSGRAGIGSAAAGAQLLHHADLDRPPVVAHRQLHLEGVARAVGRALDAEA